MTPKELKNKAAKFKIKLILCLVVIISIILLLSGCITKGGKKLTGVVPTGHGTYRLQSAVDREKREAAAEAARKKALATQVKLPPAKSSPKDTSTTPIKPTHVPPIPAVGKPTPFEPTVSEAKLPPLSPSQALIKMGEEAEAARVRPIVLEETNAETESGGQIVVGTDKESSPIKIHWTKLLIYYLIVGLSLGSFAVWYKNRRKANAEKKVKPKKPIKDKKSGKK